MVPQHKPLKPGTLEGIMEQAGVTSTNLWLNSNVRPHIILQVLNYAGPGVSVSAAECTTGHLHTAEAEQPQRRIGCFPSPLCARPASAVHFTSSPPDRGSL